MASSKKLLRRKAIFYAKEVKKKKVAHPNHTVRINPAVVSLPLGFQIFDSEYPFRWDFRFLTVNQSLEAEPKGPLLVCFK
jgi:hypothetical protein